MRTFPDSRNPVMLDYAPLDHQPHHQILVKTEDSASPDLSPVSSSLPFQFRFHPSKSTEHSTSLPHQSVYRFTEDSAHNLVPTWSDHHNLSSYSPATMSTHANHNHSRYDWDSSHLSFQYAKDYEDVDLPDLPLAGRDSSTDLSGSALSSGTEKAVRRRSSKGLSLLWNLCLTC
ncbi:hypothetical protein APHAL10511_007338 [Amanita phalloides]|nr:hypothetical protein APHAL10511_007338 [Amanita phalloides]